MFVILMYDVDCKRTHKLFKIASKYLFHEQNSVFSGTITDAQYMSLKQEVKSKIKKGDKYTFYFIKNQKYLKRVSNADDSKPNIISNKTDH